MIFFFSSRRRHTRSKRDWSSDVCSSDLDGDPKSKLRPEKEQIWFDQIFLDHMSISANVFGLLSVYERCPGPAVIRCFKHIRRHVAEGMSIKRGVSRAGVEVTRLHPA